MDNPGPQTIILRVGVSGHRELADANAVRAQVAQVLQSIKTTAQNAGRLPVQLQVVSALADGADRIVAEEGIRLGFELAAVSPAPIEQYIKKMADPAGFQILWDKAAEKHPLEGDLSDAATDEIRHESYALAGEWVLDNCEFLIAVFDINHGHKAGGTAGVVSKALEWEVPIILIDPAAAAEARLLGNISRDELKTILEAEQGKRVLPGGSVQDIDVLPNLTARFLEGENDPCRRALFREMARRQSRPLIWRMAEAFRQFWREPWQGLWLSQPKQPAKKESPPLAPPLRMLYHWMLDFRHLFAWLHNFPDYLRSRRKTSAAAPAPLPPPTTQTEKIIAAFEAERKVPRELAALYKDLFLSTYIIMVLLGLLALFFALLELRYKWRFWVKMELAAIGLILIIYAAGYFIRWQRRMVDYRLLAEWLRNALPLALLGVRPPRFAIPMPYAEHDPARTWVRTYFLRRVGEIRSSQPAPVWANLVERDQIVQYLRNEWIGKQIAYHESNHNRAASLHGVLNAFCLIIAFLLIACCLIHLRPFAEGWTALGVAAAILPAMLGACHSIAGQAELRRLMDRSAAMVFHLQRAQTRLARLIDAGATREQFGAWAQDAAKLLFEEVNEWRAVFVLRATDLPI